MNHPYLSQRLQLFPLTARLQAAPGGDRLAIAGCDLASLAERYGTPLYVYDEATMEAAVAGYRQALAAYEGASGLTYAAKAFFCVGMAQWLRAHDLWVECMGAGEIAVAVAGGVPRERIVVHGVNKMAADLDAAIAHAGTIVVDNLAELRRLSARAGAETLPNLWLRIRPGVAVETHAFTQTGQADSKFGMSRAEAVESVAICRRHSLPLAGLHFHQGSHFHDPAPVAPAIETVLDLAAALQAETGWLPGVICPGGGWGVPYHEDDLPHPPVRRYVEYVAHSLAAGCERWGLPPLHLQLEPGRSLVAQAGVALYRVGATKKTATRRWLLLDGGLSDNPRPALYGARYSALPIRDPGRPPAGPVWLAGPYCESSDVLIQDLPLPEIAPDEIIAVPVSGAYQLSMGSNYNGARRPAVLWLKDGRERLIQERETVEELMKRDRPLY